MAKGKNKANQGDATQSKKGKGSNNQDKGASSGNTQNNQGG